MKKPAEHPPAEQVASFLRAHPRFLQENPEVLMALEVPHRAGRAVSLVERQVTALRERLQALEGRYRAVLGIAEENHRLRERLHALTLKLVAAGDREHFFIALQDSLLRDFKADRVAYKLFEADGQAPGDIDQREVLARYIDAAQPHCGQLPEAARGLLFGHEDEAIGSVVLLPLSGRRWAGILAVASRDPQRFAAGMAVDFLAHLAEVTSAILEHSMRRAAPRARRKRPS